QFGDGVNWDKLHDTILALLVSPVIGFFGAALLLVLLRFIIRNPTLFQEPEKDKPPVWWVRGLLILTCTGVSFAHGSNDGQKGMGLILLILIGVVPGLYALNLALPQADVQAVAATSQTAGALIDKLAKNQTLPLKQASDELNQFLKSKGTVSANTYAALATDNRAIEAALKGKPDLNAVPSTARGQLRSWIYQVSATIGKLAKKKALGDNPADATALTDYAKKLDGTTKFIPTWVKFAVAIALGFGTMIGWKRIVVTVGERIGKSHLTYGQGMCAETVAFLTIQAADRFGLPVSTTHILSSGVAGTMWANHSGLQMQTLRNILLAWVLTLPVCVFLGSMFFAFGLRVVTALGGH
ncbi:MAG TPA: inorganic phosphate transporter, partial [Candidatus Baltobacteraceae bacterium]|nr:inorganic phosphate transporter [Candidatus Baltobacteraceae bacterium]